MDFYDTPDNTVNRVLEIVSMTVSMNMKYVQWTDHTCNGSVTRSEKGGFVFEICLNSRVMRQNGIRYEDVTGLIESRVKEKYLVTRSNSHCYEVFIWINKPVSGEL